MKLIIGCVLSGLFFVMNGFGQILFTSYYDKIKSDSKTVLQGKDNWFFLKSEVRCLSIENFWGKNAQKYARAIRPNAKDPLKAIVDYNERLKKENIKLLLLPIPPKVVIYPDKLIKKELPIKRYDKNLSSFYKVLREHGVDVLDLTNYLLNLRKSSTEPLYCLGDSHYSSYACRAIAIELVKKIREEITLKTTKKYKVTELSLSFTGDLYKMNSRIDLKETRKLYYVKETTFSDNSPILLLGDSHTLIFETGGDMFAKKAGLPSLLAAELGLPVDVIGVRGSGATPARINLYRKSKKDKDYLKRKKLIIWCFAAREFTEATAWSHAIPIK